MKIRIRIPRKWPELPSTAPLLGLAILQLTAIASPQIQDAWKLADAAREMARAGAVEQALDGYRAAMEVAPTITEIRRDYATALGWAGQWKEASRQFSRVFQMQPEQPNWAVQEMANAHFFGGNDEGALVGYDMLIARGELAEATLTRRGLTLLRLNRYPQAEQQYRQALAYYPESELAAVGIVRAMLRQGRPEDAFAVAVSWGAEAELDSEIRAWQAHLLTVLGRYDEAVAIYDHLSPERFEHYEIAQSHEAALQNAAPTEDRPAIAPEASASLEAGSDHERGVALAREGEFNAALPLLELALRKDAQNTDFRRDYAIALGWSERYAESLRQFDALLAAEPEQPVWARKELAQSQLFGGRTEQALETIDALIAEGEGSLSLRSKRGLALRWLGRSGEAAKEYKQIISEFPDSIEGHNGLAHSLADRNRLSDAISAAQHGLQNFPDDWRIRTTLAQVLNWSGRHVRAERTLQKLPEPYLESEDAMLHQTLAARWSNQPRKAYELVTRFRDKHSRNPESRELFRTLGYEYGGGVRGGFEMLSDSYGYSYRGTAETVELALSPSQSLEFGHRQRRYEDRSIGGAEITLNRYRAGWSGALGRRIQADAGAASADFRGLGRRALAEGSVSALLNDKVSVAAGAGISPAETLPALQQRLLATSTWSEVVLRPTVKADIRARVGKISYGGESTRSTAEAAAYWTVSKKWGQQIRVGAKSEWLWHDRPTSLIWSPRGFNTQLATVRVEGRLPGRFDYIAEAGSGAQTESGDSPSIPLVANFQLAKRIKPNVWLRIDSGYNTASLGRVTPGNSSYRVKYASVGLDFRFGGPG